MGYMFWRIQQYFFPIVLGVLLVFPIEAPGQNMAGLVVSDFSGTGKAAVNPAGMVLSEKYLEVRLLSGQFFFQNNVVQIPRDQFSGKLILRDFNGMLSNADPDEPRSFLEKTSASGTMDAHMHFRLAVPSVMFTFGSHTVAVGQTLRSAASFDKLPGHSSHAVIYGKLPQQDTRYAHEEPFSLGSVSWMEWNISYATLLRDQTHHQLALGISLKVNRGTHAFLFQNDHIEYEDNEEDGFLVHAMTSRANISLPVDYQDNSTLFPNGLFVGKGVSFDAGLLYSKPLHDPGRRVRRIVGNTRFGQQNRPCNNEYVPYRYRIGVSLIDIGRIRFSENLRQVDFNDVHNKHGRSVSKDANKSIDKLISEIGHYFDLEPGAIIEDRRFNIGLPASISVQFDYRVRENLFFHAIGFQSIGVFNNAITRPAYLGIIPRYTFSDFEFSLPFGLYNYSKPQLGLSVRIGNLTLGTDNLGGLVSAGAFSGMDFYLSVQAGLFKGNCVFPPRRVDCPAY